MNRKLRITFRNGDVRMGDFPEGRTLPEIWTIFKRDGAIIGDAWCAPFDAVALIEVVEITPQQAENKSTIAGVAQAIGLMPWRSAGEA